jgi:two-component system, NtrC family, response regulator HydG
MPDRKPRVMVVDDRAEMAETLADGLRDHGYDGVPMSSSKKALEAIGEPFDVLVTDLRMPEVDGLTLLTASKKAAPQRPVIVMTAFGAVDTAVESIRRGAYHYLTKPFKLDELLLFLDRALGDTALRRETAQLRAALGDRPALSKVIGKSPPMQRALEIAVRVAETDTPVLLLGETGTGKGVFAQAIVRSSKRAAQPFVAVNCAALPEPLLESELFGHVRGAFTGASSDRPGLFAEADGGTLLLDEIGEMAPALQAKLLRVLENGLVRPVGASKERAVDVRIIAATNRNLRELAAAGKFREDLLYRLDVVAIELPPLRDRGEDLPDLIEHFLQEARGRHPNARVVRLSAQLLTRILAHDWPGNLRELSHAIERVVLLGRSEEGDAADLPTLVGAKSAHPVELDFGDRVLPFRELRKHYVRWALRKLDGQRGATAARLGVDGKTLARWLEDGSPHGDDEG